ncbi:MAG: class I mannose-6-phosphate isomerase [Clostridia bacterium]|nr:class I mannose-6-phosphate isomerase [Clostridia bacterium]
MRIEKLRPAFKDYIWGGERLKEEYGKKCDLSPLAESWELSVHPDGEAKTSDGMPLSLALTKADIGKNTAKHAQFPVLTKFIDAKADLSVQVHPSDEYARKYEKSLGKTEMWYVVDAEAGAGIYLGMKEDVSRDEFEKAISEKRLTELLNFFPVKSGDCFFIPAGTIHAIGKGCLIYEIQQSSNITYRVYDYGRVGKDGKERELHVEKAKAVATLTKFEPVKFDDGILGQCDYFTARKYCIEGGTVLNANELSFHAVTVISGCGSVAGITFEKGDTFFIPAGYGKYEIKGKAEVIVTSV